MPSDEVSILINLVFNSPKLVVVDRLLAGLIEDTAYVHHLVLLGACLACRGGGGEETATDCEMYLSC